MPDLSAEPSHLPTLAKSLLGRAHEGRSGRAGLTLLPGAGAPLKQTLLALTNGTILADHENPGTATVQVVSGQVRLTSDGDPLLLTAGTHALIPDVRHGLEAIEDAVVLLTVASGSTPDNGFSQRGGAAAPRVSGPA